jgi:hypothetical protein
MRRKVYRLPEITDEEGFELPARAWNDLIGFLRRNQLIHAQWLQQSEPGHAWATTARWNEDHWECRVAPGFVNGRPAEAWSGSERLGSLVDDPPIPIRAPRRVVEVPDWFRDRWPIRAVPSTADYVFTDTGAKQELDSAAEQDAQARGGWRTLWSSPVSLRMERPRVVVDAAPDGRVLLTIAGGQSAVARLTVGGAVSEPPDNRGILLGERDPGLDSLQVATIYLLSPGNYPDTAEPDETFAAYVQHHEFWNLNYRAIAPELPEGELDLGLPFLGFGSEIIAQLVADLNRQDSITSAAMTAARVQSQWWSV